MNKLTDALRDILKSYCSEIRSYTMEHFFLGFVPDTITTFSKIYPHQEVFPPTRFLMPTLSNAYGKYGKGFALALMYPITMGVIVEPIAQGLKLATDKIYSSCLEKPEEGVDINTIRKIVLVTSTVYQLCWAYHNLYGEMDLYH